MAITMGLVKIIDSNNFYCIECIVKLIVGFTLPYSAKFWRGKTLANQSFWSKENNGEFIHLTNS